MGTYLNGFGWTVWYSLWVLYSCMIGLGLAVLQLGPVFAIVVLALYTFLFFVSTVSFHALVRKPDEEDAGQSDTVVPEVEG